MSKPDTRNATTKSKFINQENKEDNFENKNEEDEIIRNLYYNNHAETISKLMLEKIISHAITNVHSKEIYTNLGNYCFKYIKEMIKPAMKMNFIPYEIRHNEKEKIFFDRPKCNQHNTWIEIEEPKVPINDRCASDQVKYNEFLPIEFDIIQSSNVSNSHLLLIDKDLNLSEIKDFEKDENELPNKKLTLRTISKKSTESIKRSLSKNITKKNENEEEKKETKKQNKDNKEGRWIDLPSYDLPEEVYLNKYLKNDNNPELIELRKEMELEIKKREEQKKIEEELRRRELSNIQQTKKKLKDFDPKKYTFDSNGNILKLKPKNNIESNLGNEFYWSKPITKDIRTFRHQFGKAPRNSVVHIKNRKLNDFTEGIPQAKKSSKKLDINYNKLDEIEDEEEEEIDDNNNNEKKLKRRISTKLGKKTIKKMREETEIIRNPNNDDPFKINKFGFKNNTKKNDYIIPSGQNFEIIVPEVGVTIINSDKKKKEGGFNFTEKFKKPSMEQFSKLAFDTEHLNSKRFLTGSLSHDKILSSESNNQNNYIGYSQQFSNENNPLIQNSHSEIHKRESLSQSNILSNKSFFSYMNPYKSQLLNEIQLTKKMGNIPNLKILFNDTDNITSFDIKSKYKSTRPNGKNLFRRNISQNLINTLTDEYIITDEKNIDNFNSKILKNRNWGSNNEKYGDKNNYFVKPHKSNHIRELGFRIVNTRMPRDRKFVFSSNFNQNKKIGFENLKDIDNKEKNIDINSK